MTTDHPPTEQPCGYVAWRDPDSREARLPSWAKHRLSCLRTYIADLESDNRRMQEAHDVLRNRTWSVVDGPPLRSCENRADFRDLWMLRHAPVKVCTVGPEDVLIIGRDRRRIGTRMPAVDRRTHA